MPKSKQNSKRRKKLSKKKGKEKEIVVIPAHIQEQIKKLDDTSIPVEEREKMQKALYDENDKLKQEFYRKEKRIIK